MFLQTLRHALQNSGLARRFAPTPAGATADLHVILVSAADIQALNRTHLGKDRVTDVMAFDLRGSLPTPGETATTGEIYVCLDVAATAADQYTTSTGHEVLLYVVHGMLHLAGETDASPAGRRRMRNLEKRMMRNLHARFPVNDLF